jgi:lipopolysaccharide/colanic/teichoic acid biosynthesis glycosyltransferase
MRMNERQTIRHFHGAASVMPEQAGAAAKELRRSLGFRVKSVECHDISDSSRRSRYLAAKFAIEWVLAALMLVAAMPLLMLLALLVKSTSPGAVLYTQTRLGLRGRSYRIHKFRTMRQDAELRSGPVWAARNDARITPIGRVLRDTHLDELPQLWNVLRGEMALIGPRPERPELAARIVTHVPNFHDRLRVRPGITGLAQMLLPADDPTDVGCEGVRRKLAYDLAYVERLSFRMDAGILISTVCLFAAAALEAARRGTLRLSAVMVRIAGPTPEHRSLSGDLADLQVA